MLYSQMQGRATRYINIHKLRERVVVVVVVVNSRRRCLPKKLFEQAEEKATKE